MRNDPWLTAMRAAAADLALANEYYEYATPAISLSAGGVYLFTPKPIITTPATAKFMIGWQGTFAAQAGGAAMVFGAMNAAGSQYVSIASSVGVSPNMISEVYDGVTPTDDSLGVVATAVDRAYIIHASATTLTFYIDGVLVLTRAKPAAMPSVPLYVGGVNVANQGIDITKVYAAY